MKLEIDRFTLRIIPENELDVAFIEDTMGLYKDGTELSIERIDSENVEMGFRLETDLPAIPSPTRIQKTKKIETFKRPIEDLIDFEGSFEGPPFKRSGDTKVLE